MQDQNVSAQRQQQWGDAWQLPQPSIQPQWQTCLPNQQPQMQWQSDPAQQMLRITQVPQMQRPQSLLATDGFPINASVQNHQRFQQLPSQQLGQQLTHQALPTGPLPQMHPQPLQQVPPQQHIPHLPQQHVPQQQLAQPLPHGPLPPQTTQQQLPQQILLPPQHQLSQPLPLQTLLQQPLQPSLQQQSQMQADQLREVSHHGGARQQFGADNHTQPWSASGSARSEDDREQWHGRTHQQQAGRPPLANGRPLDMPQQLRPMQRGHQQNGVHKELAARSDDRSHGLNGSGRRVPEDDWYEDHRPRQRYDRAADHEEDRWPQSSEDRSRAGDSEEHQLPPALQRRSRGRWKKQDTDEEAEDKEWERERAQWWKSHQFEWSARRERAWDDWLAAEQYDWDDEDRSESGMTSEWSKGSRKGWKGDDSEYASKGLHIKGRGKGKKALTEESWDDWYYVDAKGNGKCNSSSSRGGKPFRKGWKDDEWSDDFDYAGKGKYPAWKGKGADYSAGAYWKGKGIAAEYYSKGKDRPGEYDYYSFEKGWGWDVKGKGKNADAHGKGKGKQSDVHIQYKGKGKAESHSKGALSEHGKGKGKSMEPVAEIQRRGKGKQSSKDDDTHARRTSSKETAHS